MRIDCRRFGWELLVESRELDGAQVRVAGSPVSARRAGVARLNSRTPRPALSLWPDAAADLDEPTRLHVVPAFEELSDGCANLLVDLARTIASWTDCAAGLSGPGGQVLAHFDRHGNRVLGPEPAQSTSREVRRGDTVIARVWIEPGTDIRLNELALDWGAHAAQQAIDRAPEAFAEGPHRPSWVALMVDADAPPDQRARACAELGFRPNQLIRVAVSQVPAEIAREWGRVVRRVRSCGIGQSRVELSGDEAIVVMGDTAQHEALSTSVENVRWGVGPVHTALEAPRSYRWARETLRFASGPFAEPVTHFDELGCILALGGVAHADLLDLPDWLALAELSRTETGATAILTAEMLMRTGSQRCAAACMNLHHSTVAHRIGHVEDALGYSLGEHSNWFRAQLAIQLWRLSCQDTHSVPHAAKTRVPQH